MNPGGHVMALAGLTQAEPGSLAHARLSWTPYMRMGPGKRLDAHGTSMAIQF